MNYPQGTMLNAYIIFGSDHIEQIRVTVILNIHEVETSSTVERVRRRREFTEVSDHHVF